MGSLSPLRHRLTLTLALSFLAIVLAAAALGADLDYGGAVNIADAGILFSQWGLVPTPPLPPPPNRKFQKLHHGWDNPVISPTTFTPYDTVFVHWYHIVGSPQFPDLAALGRAINQEHAVNPRTKFYLYHQVMMFDASEGGFSYIAEGFTEDMYLHNPKGSMNPADRVRSTTWGDLQYMVNSNSPAYQAALTRKVLRLMAQSGGTATWAGVFVDNMGPVLCEGYKDHWRWIVPPTSDQIQHELSGETSAVKYLRQHLLAAGYPGLVSNSTPGHPDRCGDDGNILPYVSGMMNEQAYHQYVPNAITVNYHDWLFQQRYMRRNLNAGKDIFMGFNYGNSDDRVTLSWSTVSRWETYGFASYLLYADGEHAYGNAEPSNDATTLAFLEQNLGTPNTNDGHHGQAFVNRDGNYQRDFTGGDISAVIVNPHEDRTQGGLSPQTAVFCSSTSRLPPDRPWLTRCR